MKEREVKIIELPSELGAGTRGASLGCDAVRLAGIQSGNAIHGRYPFVKAPEKNMELLGTTRLAYARNLDHFLPVAVEHTALLGDVLKAHQFPLVFSGDHSNGASVIAAVKNTWPDKKVGVIWIDAHADIHAPATTPSGNIHGMPLAATLGFDNLELKKNENTQGEQDFWEQWKKLGSKGISPKIEADSLVFIGIRDLEPEEWTVIRNRNIKYYTVAEVRQEGATTIANKALDYLSSCDLLVVSFDADSLDASLSLGTGTPVMNGIFLEEAGDLLKTFLAEPKTAALEITEINPLLDNQNKMATCIHQILVNAGL